MKRFSDFVNEVKSVHLSDAALKSIKSEIDDFLSKVKNKLDSEIIAVTYLLQNYNIYDPKTIEELARGTKNNVKRLMVEYGVSEKDANEMIVMLKNLDKTGRIRLIPMMMTKEERSDFASGSKDESDIILDLETEKGRNKIAKRLMPLVIKIASKYVGRTPMSRTDLISSGSEGLMNAIINYRKPETTDVDSLNLSDEEKRNVLKSKTQSFDKYAYFRILYQIQSDITRSHTVQMTSYTYKKNMEKDSSLNFNKSIDDLDIERMSELSEDPNAPKSADDAIAMISKAIEKEFPMKKCEIFYRLFGINGRQRVKARTIADELGVKEQEISRTKNHIISFIKSNRTLMDALRELLDIYTESVLCDVYSLGRDIVTERLISDDNYILLEELTKFENKNLFKKAMADALSEIGEDSADFIVSCIKNGFDYIDKSWNVPSSRNIIINFLSRLEPTTNYAMRGDAFYLGKMSEVLELCKKHKLYV